MAVAALHIQPSNRLVPGSHHLKNVTLPVPGGTAVPTTLDAQLVAGEWVSSINRLIYTGDFTVSSVFLENCFWRDLLCLTWDFHTLHGPDRIRSIVKDQAKKWRITSVKVDNISDIRKPKVSAFDFDGNLMGVQSFLTVETDVGSGRGLVRLLPDPKDQDKWKAFTLFTTLNELRGHEEDTFGRRPVGVEHGTRPDRKNWRERRMAEENFEDGREPTVLIVGSGQAGLTSAARLKQLSIETLIIDRSDRIGDNWRNRYRQLVLHDAVWYDHMPYLNFPPNWPVFTPKDKLAEWFEYYAGALELNVWGGTTIQESKYDDDSGKWTVTVERKMNGKKELRTFHPRHIIQATGHSGEAYLPTDIPGIDSFKGNRLVHSSQFTGPQLNVKGKKAVIVGCCNSGHDIAQDYYEHGYQVTMVQRSSTLVVKSETLIEVTQKGLYSEDGPPLEDADIINYSVPNPVAKRIAVDATKKITEEDGPLLRGLVAAGFSIDNGPDASGLMMKYLQRGGGYYIDVGASQLIADGKIKIKQGQEITRVNAHSITFADDDELEADEVVFATGYSNMRDTARKIFGDDLADRVTDVWGFDEEGETRTMWRRTGQPGFWFFGGNLALCRFYSKLLALQIKALEVGLMRYDDA